MSQTRQSITRKIAAHPHWWEELERLAAESKCSKSEYVRRAVRAWDETPEAKRDVLVRRWYKEAQP